MKVCTAYGKKKQQSITDTSQFQYQSISYTSELLRMEWIHLDARLFFLREMYMKFPSVIQKSYIS
jgi:hypothetical protein